MSKKKAIVLLSGGLDSSTVLAIAASEHEIYALTFDYGQRHKFEIDAAKIIAKDYNVKEHRVANVDLRLFGGSALTDNIDVPESRKIKEIEKGIPITYVPARNTIFLSFALAWAEVISATTIFIGVNAIDYSGYPDCRPEFIDAFQKLAQVSTRLGSQENQIISIQAPLLLLKKSEIILKGTEMGVDYSKTITCYNPDNNKKSCGVCDACILRLRGFKEAGIVDPVEYVELI